jgi:hypothetical protein
MLSRKSLKFNQALAALKTLKVSVLASRCSHDESRCRRTLEVTRWRYPLLFICCQMLDATSQIRIRFIAVFDLTLDARRYIDGESLSLYKISPLYLHVERMSDPIVSRSSTSIIAPGSSVSSFVSAFHEGALCYVDKVICDQP